MGLKDLLSYRPLGAILISLVLLYPIYYICGPYSQIDDWYEQQKWTSPGEAHQSVIIASRCSKYISDFLKEDPDIEIAIGNPLSDVQIIPVTLVISPAGKVYVQPIGSKYRSDSVIVELQPFEEKVVAFSVWAPAKIATEKYSLSLMVKGEPFLPFSKLTMEYNRPMKFRIWLTQQLLLPPGVNVVIPAIVILSVILGSNLENWLKSFKTWWASGRKLLRAKVILMGLFVLASTGMVMYLLPTWGSLLMLIVAVALAGLAGWTVQEEKTKTQAENSPDSP